MPSSRTSTARPTSRGSPIWRPCEAVAVLEVRPDCRRGDHARAAGGGFAPVHGCGRREHPCADLLLDGWPGLALARELTVAGRLPSAECRGSSALVGRGTYSRGESASVGIHAACGL
ncbi:hypothetical protein GQY15_11110 [Rhodobacter sphaeroides]|nr:hypothetical protein [Cereibacter sphaeroides]